MYPHRLHLSRAVVPTVAVVCGRTRAGNLHAGLLFNNGGRIVLLHQLWDYWTRGEPFDGPGGRANDRFPSGYVYATPDIEPEQANDIVGWCKLIWNRYPANSPPGDGIPFAFEMPLSPQFAPRGAPNEGEFLLTADGIGLTCSLFVLAIFQVATVPLVQIETWESRPEDDRRHATLLVQLRTLPDQDPHLRPPTESHIMAVAESLNRQCIRIRPEETVGSCLLDRPSSFRPTEVAGEWVLSQL